MLVWSGSGRFAARSLLLGLLGVVYLLPLGVIALASVAGQWNGMLPSHLTLIHYRNAFGGDAVTQLRASLITGAAASVIALLSGTWAAIALRDTPARLRQVLDVAFLMPSAVPSVSVGLGLLVAFSRPPVLLNGTTAIVVIAHFVMIAAFTYGNVAAGLKRLAPELEQVAASLGARPEFILRRVTLPLLLPYLLAALSLSVAMSMGELGATAMVYPPGWATLPVGIFALTDRGAIFDGAALTILLTGVTLAVLVGVSAMPSRAAEH